VCPAIRYDTMPSARDFEKLEREFPMHSLARDRDALFSDMPATSATRSHTGRRASTYTHTHTGADGKRLFASTKDEIIEQQDAILDDMEGAVARLKVYGDAMSQTLQDQQPMLEELGNEVV
jgi:hypothetical protein